MFVGKEVTTGVVRRTSLPRRKQRDGEGQSQGAGGGGEGSKLGGQEEAESGKPGKSGFQKGDLKG